MHFGGFKFFCARVNFSFFGLIKILYNRSRQKYFKKGGMDMLRREDGIKLDTSGANDYSDYSDNIQKDQTPDRDEDSSLSATLWEGKREELFSEVANVMSNFFNSSWHPLSDFSGFSRTVGKWPKMDIEEDDNNYYIVVAAPGFSPEEVNIELKSGVGGHILVITVEKDDVCSYTKKHYSEIRWSKGERCIPIAGSFRRAIDIDNIKAEFKKDGIVLITLPKTKEVVTSKKIIIE